MSAPTLPASVLTKKQTCTYGPRAVAGYGPGAMLTVAIRYDDQCGNGHNSFAITGEVVTPDSKRRNDCKACGCLHDDIARVFPELAPLIKWHHCGAGGPMHYTANTVYHAGDRDCHGLRAGEFRQHTSRGPHQADGVAGVPCWELVTPERGAREVYSHEKPAPVVCEWQPYGRTGEGKARDLAAARSCAIWPDATDAQLCADPEELRAALRDRLPALMVEFRAAVQSLGFTY